MLAVTDRGHQHEQWCFAEIRWRRRGQVLRRRWDAALVEAGGDALGDAAGLTVACRIIKQHARVLHDRSNGRMGYRIGVDIGGSFTDFVAFDEASGRLESLKVFSRPDQPGAEVIEGMRLLEQRRG